MGEDGVTAVRSASDFGGRFPTGWRPLCLWAPVALILMLFLPPALATAQETIEYILGPGDKVRITVFEEEDLTGEFEVTTSGMISFPLIGQVRASGGTLTQLETVIAQLLLDGYLKSPRVNAEVLNYRPFFIEGEVQAPGQYPYVSAMTIREAVAIAGGYTYRAREDDALLIRRLDANRQPTKVPVYTIVLPGDFIEIEERFF